MAQNAVVMDQPSYELLRGSLPARANLVISERQPYRAPGCYIVDCLCAAIRIALVSEGFEKLFVIGNSALQRFAFALGGVQAS
jgi:dihydrofolate reductase